jgi:hypothetical protein
MKSKYKLFYVNIEKFEYIEFPFETELINKDGFSLILRRDGNNIERVAVFSKDISVFKIF